MKTARQSRASYFKYEPLEAFEAVELAPFRADRKVQERFIKSALPIVWKTVKRMRVVDSLKDDAEQEGLLGAAHALTLWDPDKGAYHPYARLWVRQRVWLCVTKNRPRFPALSLDVVDEDGSSPTTSSSPPSASTGPSRPSPARGRSSSRASRFAQTPASSAS